MNTLKTEQLKLETFVPWLKSKFRVVLAPDNRVELELAEANALTHPGQSQPLANGLVQEAFSLIFHGPDNRFLAQRLYPFEHDGIGRFELFIVPIGQKPGYLQYQAVFNRLVKPD